LSGASASSLTFQPWSQSLPITYLPMYIIGLAPFATVGRGGTRREGHMSSRRERNELSEIRAALNGIVYTSPKLLYMMETNEEFTTLCNIECTLS
jgi:hypothetical protein